MIHIAERKDFKSTGSPLGSVLLVAQVLAAVSAGVEGNTLHLLVRPLSWILSSYVESSLCVVLVHVLPKSISPAE